MLNERNQGPARIVVQRQANKGCNLVTAEADTLIAYFVMISFSFNGSLTKKPAEAGSLTSNGRSNQPI